MTSEQRPALADQVRRLRLRAGLSQEALAERAGLTANTVGALERGLRRRLYPNTVLALAGALSLDEDERAELAALASGRAVGVEVAPAPKAPPDAPPTGATASDLPAPLTSFVGRERELGAIGSLIDGGARLLTLAGPGGVGKSRLAVERARAVGRHFPSGTWIVELAPLTDPTLVPQALAGALGVRDTPGQSFTEGIVAALRGQTALLLLDNCEHLLDACAGIASTLLRGCPRVAIVATSREPLRVMGEQVYPVPPLSFPPEGTTEQETGNRTLRREHSALAEPDALLQHASIQLFIDRARAVQPAFVLTAANAGAVAEICRRLDGLPLAIELAAARVRLLTPQQIAARLDDRFQLLVGRMWEVDPRHQTLQALIDWSHHLLTEAEQVLLRRLAVFAGGCALEAVERVCSDPPPGATGEPQAPPATVLGDAVIELLTALVDKSLVVADVQPAEARYQLLESIREYAAEKLAAAGETEWIRGQHAAYMQQFAHIARRALIGPAQAEWVERLELEHHNLRAALAWTLARGDAETAVRLCASLSMFWYITGHYREGRDWTARALACGPTESPRPRAIALHGAAALAGIQRDYGASLMLIGESVALWRVIGDPRGLAGSLAELAMHARHVGDLAAARQACEEALSIYATSPEPWGERLALGVLGWVAEAQGDRAEAQRLMERSLAAAQAAGSPTDVALQLNNLGVLALRRGDSRAAMARYRDALHRGQDVGAREPMACSLEGLGGVAAARGRNRQAAWLLGAAAAVRAAIASPRIAQFEEEYRRIVPRVRQELGDEAFEAALAAGRAAPLAEAIACALEESEPDASSNELEREGAAEARRGAIIGQPLGGVCDGDALSVT